MELREKYFTTDELIIEVIPYIAENNKTISISEIQEKFHIGSNRAASIIGWLERYGFLLGCDCCAYHVMFTSKEVKNIIERIEIVL